MGIVRFLLALSVVADHCGLIFGSRGTGGKLAVQLFFIISGFYITFIIKEKYVGKNSSYNLFITNRFLRIYSLYWVVFISTVLFYAVTACYMHNWPPKFQPFQDMPWNPITIFYFIFSSITLVGHDLMLFLGLDAASGRLFFTSQFWQSNLPFHKMYLLPQAWSLSLEIWFYVLAPFLIRKNKWVLLLVLLLSIGVRLMSWVFLDLKVDPWTYRFFPFELALFILGYFSYQIYASVKKQRVPAYVYWSLIGIFSLTVYFFQDLNNHRFNLSPFGSKEIVFLLFTTVSIPVFFSFSKGLTWDNYLGELSYPIYLWHIFAQVLLGTFSSYFAFSTKFGGEIVASITLILSLFTVKFILPPIERFRQSRLFSGQL